jgi:F-type H+-transporting ATPase subunit b
MLSFDPITVVITLINLVVLYYVMRKIFYKPVTKFMANRTAKIQDELTRTAKDREAASMLLADYNKKLADAEAEADAKAADILKKAGDKADKIVAEGQAKAQSIIEAARKQTAAEQAAAWLVFRKQASQLVLMAAGKLLRKQLSGDEVQQLAEQALAECAS